MMNLIEARKEAKKRYGVYGFAKINRYTKIKYVGVKVHFQYLGTDCDDYLGGGETWEEAFAKADEKENATRNS